MLILNNPRCYFGDVFSPLPTLGSGRLLRNGDSWDLLQSKPGLQRWGSGTSPGDADAHPAWNPPNYRVPGDLFRPHSMPHVRMLCTEYVSVFAQSMFLMQSQGLAPVGHRTEARSHPRRRRLYLTASGTCGSGQFSFPLDVACQAAAHTAPGTETVFTLVQRVASGRSTCLAH